MEKTIVCYLACDGKYLMLYRNKKKIDPNKDKWITVGGHTEENETKEEACIREVYEETGFRLLDFKHLGQVLFTGDFEQSMDIFVSHSFEGQMHECDEGELAWFTKDEILKLNMWEGDYLFINDVFNESSIELEICYLNGKLKEYHRLNKPSCN